MVEFCSTIAGVWIVLPEQSSWLKKQVAPAG
jgi:hypothetical protein